MSMAQIIPLTAASPSIEARDTVSGTCDCLSGGAIAGIVIGCILATWLIYCLFRLTSESGTAHDTRRYTYHERYDRPRRSSHASHREKPIERTRRYHRHVEALERPPKVYIHES